MTESRCARPIDGLGHAGVPPGEAGQSGAGGWNAFCTTWAGLALPNPGSSFPLQAIGRKGWLGWYSNPKMVALHDRWFEAPDLAAQKAVKDMQQEAFASPPFLPPGQWRQPWAFRNTLKNFVRCGNVLFWGVERA